MIYDRKNLRIIAVGILYNLFIFVVKKIVGNDSNLLFILVGLSFFLFGAVGFGSNVRVYSYLSERESKLMLLLFAVCGLVLSALYLF